MAFISLRTGDKTIHPVIGKLVTFMWYELVVAKIDGVCGSYEGVFCLSG